MRLLIVGTAMVVLLSIVGWWFLMYSPAREQQAALEAEITDFQAREQQLANQRQQLLGLQERAPEIRRSLDRLSQFVPPDPDQASFLELLQVSGNAAGVTFTSLSFSDPRPVEGAPAPADPRLVLGEITVQGTVESSYFQLVDFLRRIEIEVPRAVLVGQVAVVEGPDGFPQVTTTFTAQMFALIAAPVTDSPEGTAPGTPATGTPTPGPTPAPGATTPPATPAPTTPADPAQSSPAPGADPPTGEVQTSRMPPGTTGSRATTTTPAATGRPA